MRRLRDSLEVSGHDQHHAHARAEEVPSAVTTSEISRASVEDKGQGSAIMDMSRYAQYLQQPARYLEPVLQALGRTSTRVIFKLLRCSALLALRFGCELLLGLQLAQSASSLAGIAMLIPKSLTPFTYGDRLNPLVRDGQVGSVFSLPSTFDALRLALPIFDPSKVEALVERADLDFEVQLLETLDLRSSVASVALQLLAAVSRLVTLRYAIVMVDADPVWLLEAQRNGRYLATEEHFRQNTRSVQDRSEEDKSEERSRAPAEENDVGRAGPGYETMEELCADLARLARRLDGQKPAGRKPEQVLAVLGSEIACAGRQLALMLRWSGRRLQQDPEAPDLRQWSRLIEGCESSHPRWLLPLDVRKMTPVPKNSPCMENWDELGSMRPEMPDSECVEAMPAIVRLREGAGSYLAQFHPELCSEFRALAGALRQQFVVEPPCAKVDIIRLPWLAPSSSPKLLRLPLGLSHKRRQQLSRARASLAERCRVLVHKNMSIDQAVYAEAEFYGLYLLRERLQEAVVAGQLGLSKLPTDKEGIARFRTQMAATIPPEEPAEPLFGELEPQALSREVAAIRTQLAKLMPALSQLLHSATSEWLSEEVAALTSLQYRLQATKSAKLTKPTGAPSTSASIIDQSPATSISKSPTLKEAHKSGSRISISREASLLTGGPYASKLVGQTAINQLLQKSTYVRMGNDPEGETAHVLKELQINACLEELADELWSWGRHIALTREKRTEEALGYLDHLKDVLKFCLAKTEVDTIREGHLLESPAELVWLKGFADEMKGKREEMEAQFRADLAARCVKMVFEVDRAHRAQRDLKAAAGEIQSRLQGEIMDQVRGSISNFTGALAAEAGRFKESHGDDQDRLAVQLRDLREHVTSELASLAAKNQAVQMKAAQPRQVGLETLLPEKDGAIDFQALASELEAEDDRSPLKRRHSGMARRNSNAKPPVLTLTVSDGMYQKLAEVAQREDVYVLQRRLQQLKDRQLMERIFHKLKCQAMRQHFERKVQEQEATLGSNSSLLAQLAHVSRAESAAAKDFIRGAQDVSHAEKRTEELGPLTESNAEQKRRLAKWKKNKSKQLYHMKKGVRDHEMAGTMDVASLLQDIQQKQELVKILQQNQKESEQEVLLASARSAKDTARVRAALMEQRQVKDETFRELQRLRADMQRPEGQKNVEYWREKVLEIRQRMEDLEEENSKLRILLASRTE
ncbi:unnamed protein product [Effrenium voratum]|nr:unnamed protein product [Effrenium voratum]